MNELLIVDDEESFRRSTARILRHEGYVCLEGADAAEAREMLAGGEVALVLLDVNMPGESGIDLLGHIRTDHPGTAVVMLTGEDSTRLAMTALETGAYGYVVKPYRRNELLINVANALIRRGLEAQAKNNMERLRSAVEERTRELLESVQRLEVTRAELLGSYSESILKLARLAEFRDEETGHHVERMSRYCGLLAGDLGLDDEEKENIEVASRLHDVGKIAVPDGILFKPGKLTPEEFDVVKQHARRGYEILSDSSSEVVGLGATIAWDHHERWDGTGYPRGLAGTEIPLEGRVAAVADVFDALTSRRVYRPAFPVQSAIEMMEDERGKHFDPDILDSFLKGMDEVVAVRERFVD